MKKLVILEMESSRVKDDWFGYSEIKLQLASSLKVISLQCCDGIRTAPDLSQCRDLEWIDLRRCYGMRGELHIGNLLKNLKLLRFSDTGITKLTGEVGTLENLQVFDSGYLRYFSSDNGKLFSPEIMPTSLNQLSISSCRVLNLSELKDLEELIFENCSKLQLLGGIWKLSKLKTLSLTQLSCCNSLLVDEDGSSTCFPLPSSLNSLDISGREPLESLPNFANLSNLKYLTLVKFEVSEIQGLGDLIMLETLVIKDALNLIHLDGLESLYHLNALKLYDCRALEKLPSLANLTKLDELAIDSCPLLYGIRGMGELREFSQSSLHVEECLGLTHDLSMEPLMPSLWKLVTLRNLTLYRYNQYTDPSSDHYVGTNSDHVPSREQFVDLSGLQNIEKIIICGYRQLSKVYGLHKLKSLKSLNLGGCTSMRELPDGLENTNDIVSECTSFTKLPDLSALMNLRTLNIFGCTGLTEVVGIQRLELLTNLNMSGCSSVEELPDLSGLRNIFSLDISECNKLKEITGIGSLELLAFLDMMNCTSVKKLPDLSGCKTLRRLDIRGCIQLAEVRGIDKLKGLIVKR